MKNLLGVILSLAIIILSIALYGLRQQFQHSFKIIAETLSATTANQVLFHHRLRQLKTETQQVHSQTSHNSRDIDQAWEAIDEVTRITAQNLCEDQRKIQNIEEGFSDIDKELEEIVGQVIHLTQKYRELRAREWQRNHLEDTDEYESSTDNGATNEGGTTGETL